MFVFIYCGYLVKLTNLALTAQYFILHSVSYVHFIFYLCASLLAVIAFRFEMCVFGNKSQNTHK